MVAAEAAFVAAFPATITLKFAYDAGDTTVSLPSCVTMSMFAVVLLALVLEGLARRMMLAIKPISRNKPIRMPGLRFIPANRHR